jgi:UDP-arabinose 4-epimerase
MKKVVVTGGAGYIGSHVCKAAASQGWEPVVIDNLSTGHRRLVQWGELVVLDTRETDKLTAVLCRIKPDAVMHFAASAYVGESIQRPLDYYSNNVGGTLSLLQACIRAGVQNLIFSSSCAIYGVPPSSPVHEETPASPLSPYGETKLACERMLNWCQTAHGINWVALRYFNAAGADPDAEIGELHDPETHLIPLALHCVSGKRTRLDIYGADYPTRDGTAIRDYIHVTDLASAHLLALDYLAQGGGSVALNLGTGRGHSVYEIVRAVERVTGRTVPYRICDRRPGDPPELYALAESARRTLGWQPRFCDIGDIVRTAWDWEQRRDEL